MSAEFVDIHCHLLPAIDDGAKSWSESLAMARMAVADGIGAIVATPHQMGAFAHNKAADIRQRVAALQEQLHEHEIALKVFPGGDVRIESDMMAALQRDEVLTLADRKKHVLLELPHELYFPLEPVLRKLEQSGLRGILSHPERNQGLLQRPELLAPLVEGGCLMQITAGSLMGTFGPRCQDLAESMLRQGFVHFVASDAHGVKSRRPLLSRAYSRVAEIVDEELADDLCCRFPAAVAFGGETPRGRMRQPSATTRNWAGWLPWRRVA